MLFLGLISADTALCHALGEQLKQEAVWQHAIFPSLEEALAAWSEALPPLILWDAQKSPATEEMASFFATRLASKHPSPLLVVIGDVPAALEKSGVTETLARPLRLGYLLTRLQFYQRLLQQAPDVEWTLGPWKIAPRARKLSLQQDGSGEAKLTDKEVAVLEYLYAAQSPVSREELLAAIWGYDARIDTHTLETHIYRLRRKLMEGQGTWPDIFLTEGGGYQINPVWRAP